MQGPKEEPNPIFLREDVLTEYILIILQIAPKRSSALPPIFAHLDRTERLVFTQRQAKAAQ